MENGRLSKSFDIIGDIAIVKFEGKLTKKQKLELIKEVLEKNKNIKRVFEKTGIIEGNERIPKLKLLIGKGSLALYKENGFNFYVDVKKVFFSPRLGNERLRVIKLVKENEKVLDMFCGVGPFSIPIAKKCKNVVAIDINKKAIELLQKNIELNKIKNIEFYCGDSKKVVKKLNTRFNRIIMNFPLYAYKFLEAALQKADNKCTIHLYAFIKDGETKKFKKEIRDISEKYFRKVKIRENKVGEVAPFLERYCFDLELTNFIDEFKRYYQK